MNRLNIQQSSNVEIVGADLILKLYETALTTSDITLVGSLLCDHCKETAYNYLTGVENGVKRFPDLLINVTGGVYIEFADPEVERVLLSKNIGDGVGITSGNMNSLTSIPYRWFNNNTTITLFPELGRFSNITSLGSSAFYGDTNLTSIDLTNILRIGGECFKRCGLTGVVNLPSIIRLGDSNKAAAFTNCTSMTLCNIGSSFDPSSSYLDSTFYFCTALQAVTGLGSVTSIPSRMFQRCGALTSVDIDFSNVTNIGDFTFEYCTGLQINAASLSNLLTIEQHAFDYCSGLTGVLSLPNVTDIGYDVFRGTGISKMYCNSCVGGYSFYSSCPNLERLEMRSCTGTFYPFSCENKHCIAILGNPSDFEKMDTDVNMDIVILNGTSVAPLNQYWGAHANFKLYVPDALVQSYKAADKWSLIADKIYPLSNWVDPEA